MYDRAAALRDAIAATQNWREPATPEELFAIAERFGVWVNGPAFSIWDLGYDDGYGVQPTNT